MMWGDRRFVRWRIAGLALLWLHVAGIRAEAETVDFSRAGLDGETVSLSDHRGKWTVVNFWATWCGPCIREIPLLEDFHAARGDAVVIGVNFETIDRELLRRFVDEMGISYPVVQAGEQPLLPFEPLKGLPTTFVVTPAGELTAVRVGEVDRTWLDRETRGTDPR